MFQFLFVSNVLCSLHRSIDHKVTGSYLNFCISFTTSGCLESSNGLSLFKLAQQPWPLVAAEAFFCFEIVYLQTSTKAFCKLLSGTSWYFSETKADNNCVRSNKINAWPQFPFSLTIKICGAVFSIQRTALFPHFISVYCESCIRPIQTVIWFEPLFHPKRRDFSAQDPYYSPKRTSVIIKNVHRFETIKISMHFHFTFFNKHLFPRDISNATTFDTIIDVSV